MASFDYYLKHNTVASLAKEEFYKHQNRINRKILDFVVFERKNLAPVLAIEYDGPTHERSDRGERDQFIDHALEPANIKILHIQHRNNVDYENIGREVASMLTSSQFQH